MTLTIKMPATLPDGMTSATLAEAAARGISNALKRHFRARNQSSKHREGMPRSNFWAHVADSVQTEPHGNKALVSIDHEGVALHFEGGRISPKRGKALTIPLSPAVWDRNPREADPTREKLALVWPKGKSAGILKNKETGDAWYLLVSKADIPSDTSVLPQDATLERAGSDAINF